MVLNYTFSTYFGHGMFIQDIDLLSMSVFRGLAKQSDMNNDYNFSAISPSPALWDISLSPTSVVQRKICSLFNFIILSGNSTGKSFATESQQSCWEVAHYFAFCLLCEFLIICWSFSIVTKQTLECSIISSHVSKSLNLTLFEMFDGYGLRDC